MSLIYSSVVDAPLDEVFAWHERPGAIHRLSPPWQPMSVVREASTLDGGRAVLGLPLGLRWGARHTEYAPPHRFVDELDSAPLSWAVRWRHSHEFRAEGERTLMTDRVDTPVPGVLLRSMFAYRHRQLAADLAAQRAARLAGDRPLTVALTGSGGLVGRALGPFLTTAGHRVVRLVRRAATGPDERTWHPDRPAPDLLAGVDAVVHLAGASIAGRFTESHRTAIRESRIGPTRALAGLAAASGVPVFVSASAIGIYGADRGDEELTEESERGEGFLADVVADWEAATEVAGVRVVTVRTGLVQSPAGGTLRIFHPLFAAGLGGRLGDGRMWQSWIGIDDLVDVYHRALYDTSLSGPVNAVAPQAVRNSEYTRVLARVLRRPALLPVPSFGPRVLLGEQGARELAEASQLVRPAVLTKAGHAFRYPDLEPALRHLLGR
ncbi:TIGR01777 family oxidoreductase [Nocardia sp. NRRL S-836]|uniref:TIGR01777 family oxidoreductase n=1 Tax=Nocardia sp. NRRL S-836 TaxID=1519492 RepID=UPI0006B01389|nr:TIGR01777 family oxidoreductase [Nocardia sp. NRRL S-836]KOV78212.1 nucleoside-diphosphate sugar epimerase [Nocardia sp. NRRL S-836]